MRFLIQIILIMVFTGIIQMYLPWWSLMIVCFTVTYIIRNNSPSAFLSSFLGVGILWFAYARNIDLQTASILTNKIYPILGLPNKIYLIVITALIGAIAGGFSGLSGHLFLEALKNKRK